jgi:RNA polymerase sigma-70 factor, ECF subfamily
VAPERVNQPPATAAGSAGAAAERAARDSYGRLVALLAAPTRDLALAEDALGDAFEEALRRWPSAGVPANPEAWLLMVARNRQRDVWRSPAHRRRVWREAAVDGVDEVDAGPALEQLVADDLDALPDRRLGLLLACAHPAVDPAARTPLMLQVVLGFDAAAVANAFAVPVATMAQRLVRAKRRIRDAGVPFTVPARDALPDRLPAVLEAVYACAVLEGGELVGEARHLATLLATLLHDEPEAWGLAALTTFAAARARAGTTGGYVPLEEQDPARWDLGLLGQAEAQLRRASAVPPGRFQLEAAISAVHADRARTGRTDWAALDVLYRALLIVAPTLGARVAAAGVAGRRHGPAAGLAALDDLAAEPGARTFQPWWAVRAHLLRAAGRDREAAAAYAEAAALSADGAVRDHLRQQAGTH